MRHSLSATLSGPMTSIGCIAAMVALTVEAAAQNAAVVMVPARKSPQSQQTIDFPHWLAGAWREEKNGTWTEEYWTPMRGGIMLGAGRSGKGDRLSSWEAMQIRLGTNDKLSFFGMPGGAPATRFTVVRMTASEVIFENGLHDYPQRIRYWREGALLNAETSLIDGSKTMRWTYRRMGT